MKSLMLGVEVKKIKRFMQRGTLFFLVLTLVFGLFEPGVSYSSAMPGSQKEFNTDYQLAPLNSEKPSDKRNITADDTSIRQNLETQKIENPKSHKFEDINRRTPFTSTHVNNDGTRSLEWTPYQQNYEKNGKWLKLSNKLIVQEEVDASTAFKMSVPGSNVGTKVLDRVTAEAGTIQGVFKPLAEGLTVNVENKKFTIIPDGAKNVRPERLDGRSVIYRNAWNSVDIIYEMRGESIKEVIVLKSKDAKSSFRFAINGAKVIPHPVRAGELAIEGLSSNYSFSSLTLDLQDRGVISETKAVQYPAKDGKSIEIVVDAEWLKKQPASSFPVRVDPSFQRAATNYWMFKSDGYACNASNCHANIGAIYDGGWKNWRTYLQFPYGDMAGKRILNANMRGVFQYGKNGLTDGRWIAMGHANCIGYSCQGQTIASALVGTDFDMNFTGEMQNVVNSGNFGATWSFWGEEGTYKSFKPYYDMIATINYDTPTPVAQPIEPANAQVTPATQPILKVGSVSDADGDAVQYYFRVSTNPSAEGGAVINSGWLNTPQWTVPDGILQDGTTYYWHTYTLGATQTNPNWVRSFKVDRRTGQDSSQTLDTVGPVGINLATGNAVVESGSHSMSALGGSIGIGLNYNTPQRAKKGLKAEYWNIASGRTFAEGAPTGAAQLVRTDPDVNFKWDGASPGGKIGVDNWYSRWTGKMVVPRTGGYTFGASFDDEYAVYVNNTKVAGNACCSGVARYVGSAPVSLTAGQAIDLRVEYKELGGHAQMQLYAKGAVDEQIVPREWLFSEDTDGSKLYGLTGRYYTDNSNAHDIDAAGSDPMRLMFARQDTKMALNFGAGSPAAGMQTDNFMARWTGYITVPASGDYQLGVESDDGARIRLSNGAFGTQTTPLDKWSGNVGYAWSSNVRLDAGRQVPIAVDWYEGAGLANIRLLVRGNGITEQEIPVSWLTPQANAVPEGWQLNVDVDGNIAYERLRLSGNDVILENSSRQTYTYTAISGGGYKPPINEDGVLVKNIDGTFTLTDVDGRVYIFNTDGTLKSLTSPADDRTPAALKYSYGTNQAGGGAPRLLRIEDGVNANRYATLHYKGVQDENMCGHSADFDDAPSGMLCAIRTTDGRETKFYYKGGQLARVVLPGNELTDYQYNAGGQVTAIRDSLAGDVIAAGLRSADAGTTTQLAYDAVGRISSVKAPAPTAGAGRLEHTFTYKPGLSVGINRLHKASAPSTHILTSAKYLEQSQYDIQTMVHMLREQVPGTVPIYSCLRSNGTRYATALQGCHIAQNTNVGIIGYLYSTPTGQAVKAMARIRAADGYVLEYPATSLAGWTTEEVLGYGFDKPVNDGITEMHITGAPEPNGFSKRIEYDGLLRSTKVTDLTGKTTQTEWDATKDLQLSATDPTGLKSTTIYDSDDRAVDQYGPAPSGWFGADRKPFAGYSAQVPRAGSGYDEGIVGPAVSWYRLKGANMALVGTPVANTTGFSSNQAPESGNTAYLRHVFGSQALPFGATTEAGVTGYGFVATGKFTAPQTATYTLTMHNDDSGTLLIDDRQIFTNWGTKTANDVTNMQTGTFAATAGKSYRFQIRYGYDGTAKGRMALEIKGPGIPDTMGGGVGTRDWSAYLKPGYNLQTSAVAYDAQLGNITSTTQYANPAYGTVAGSTLDPTGLNYAMQATYETPGVGFLRQTSKTMPGGGTTSYQHYSAADIRDNPCTTEVEAFLQAARAKGKVEADPDGSGPKVGRSSEVVYNDSGNVVALRYNTDPWTCTTYDIRGRVLATIIPGRTENGQTVTGRTITNNYAVGGNPLITSTGDAGGTVKKKIDLLGRTVEYTDASNSVTTGIYDIYGKLTAKTSVLGLEAYTYDNYDRLIIYKLDGVTFATIAYDQYSRIQTIQYPAGISLEPAIRDSLSRVSKVTYKVGSQYLSDQVVRSTSGIVTSGVENGKNKTYSYDKSSRLTQATIGSDTFAYEFGTLAAGCTSVAGNNPNAAKNSNRTKLTINGQVTTYCYDYADRLIDSSDVRFGLPAYDSHGNMTTLGSAINRTALLYDAGDRNTKISETAPGKTTEITYTRDATDRIISRTAKENGTTKSQEVHIYNGTSSSPAAIRTTAGQVVAKYLSLPGGVSVKINPQSTSAGATTYSLSNIHGDTMATVSADGALIGTYMTGPFGEKLTSANDPSNATIDTTYGYVGKHQKVTESALRTGIIQMGSRVYIPELGRFLQVDTVEGGTMNNYVYVMDPVNEQDLSGQFAFAPLLMIVKAVVHATVRVLVPAMIGLGPIRGPVRMPVLKPLPSPPVIRAPNMTLRPPSIPAASISPQTATRLNQIRSGQGAQPGYRPPHVYQNYEKQLPVSGNYITHDVYRRSSFRDPMENRQRIIYDAVSGKAWYSYGHYTDSRFMEIY